MSALDPEAAATRRTGWKTLFLAWLLFLVPVPLVSSALGAVCMVFPFMAATVLTLRGAVGEGMLLFAAAVVGSPLVYVAALALYGALAA
jgi:hypothetical protein